MAGYFQKRPPDVFGAKLSTIFFDDDINPVFVDEREQEMNKSNENRIRFANI